MASAGTSSTTVVAAPATALSRHDAALGVLRRPRVADAAAGVAPRPITPFVTATTEGLDWDVPRPVDLGCIREPVLATLPYGAGGATRARDVFVLHGNAGRVALRAVHDVMAAVQSTRAAVGGEHLGVLADRWGAADHLLTAYTAIAERVWGGWVAAADGAASAAAGRRVAPIAGALGRLVAAVAAANAAWAVLSASRRPEGRLPDLWAALHAASASAVAAFARVEGALPPLVRGALGGVVGAARRADAAAVDVAAEVLGGRVAALAAVTLWMPSAAWADHVARVHLRGGGAGGGRRAVAAARAVAAERAAEVAAWTSATTAVGRAPPVGGAAGADRARMGASAIAPPVLVQ